MKKLDPAEKQRRTIARRKAQYAADPEKYKRLANEWYHSHPEKAKAARIKWKSAHRAYLAAQERARYRANRELARAKAKEREQRLGTNRRLQIERRIALDDVYVRGELAKHSALQPKDFPPELVELKRLQLKIKRGIEANEKHN